MGVGFNLGIECYRNDDDVIDHLGIVCEVVGLPVRVSCDLKTKDEADAFISMVIAARNNVWPMP